MKPFVGFTVLARSIRRQNARFAAMSADRKRVTIARDVIRLLDAKAFIPRFANGYLVLHGSLHRWHRCAVVRRTRTTSRETLLVRQLSRTLPRLPPCSVCGVGAAMLATILIRDGVTGLEAGLNVNDGVPYQAWAEQRRRNPVAVATEEIFGADLLAAIERAFEPNLSRMPTPTTLGTGGYTGGPSARLRAIYGNIIDNDGKRFTSRDGKDVLWGEALADEAPRCE